jgi:hypothetical protein
MALQSDSQGFLVAESIVTDIRRNKDILSAIRLDVAAIKRAVVGAASRNAERSRQQNTVTQVTRQRAVQQQVTAIPRSRSFSEHARDSSGRFIANQTVATPSEARSIIAENNTAIADTVPQVTGQNRAINPVPVINDSRQAVTPNRQVRDSSGRFVSSANTGSERNTATRNSLGRFTSNGEGDSQASNTMIGRMADRIASAVTESSNSLEEIDPSVKAFNEVAQPLARTYQVLTGGNGNVGESRWLKKIFSILKITRQDSTLFQRTTARTLRNIEGNTQDSGNNSNGLTGFLTGLLTVGGKALLKKVPILGALLSAIGAFGEVSENEDSNLTRQQKDEHNGSAIGGAMGSFGGLLGGAKLGAMAGSFLGPIGTVVGTVVGGAAGMFFGEKAGNVLGEVTGFWVNELREADIPGMISNAWISTTDFIKSGWNDAVKLFSDTWDGISKTFAPIIEQIGENADWLNGFIKEKTGIDVKAKAQAAYNTVKDGLGSAKDAIADKVNKSIDWVKEGVSNSSIGKGVGYISGLIDADGKKRIYKKDDGSEEIREGGSKSWRNNNPGNLRYAKQKGSLGADNDGFAIFDSLASGEKAREKLLFENGGYKNKTLTDAIAKYAPPNENNTKLYQKRILEAVGGSNKRMSEYSDKERQLILDAMEKVEGFKQGSISIKNPAMAMNNVAMPVQNAAIKSAPSPSMPTMPKPQAIADMPTVQAPLNNDAGRQNLTVSVEKGLAGQDVSSRSIAHLVTGGLSG